MATLLAKAISFKLLIKQLSKDEFLTLMSKIFDTNQSNLISTSLFNYFMHQKSITNPNTNNLNDINLILSDIIQSRKSKPKPLLISDVKLDKFPKTIIGHIASFLLQNDYFSFQNTNRNIFIGCNSPNMLNELDLTKINNYSSIPLPQFKSLKTLKISLCKFNEFKLPQNGQFILNELNHLHLDGNANSNFDIEPFMKQNCINISNIKNVDLSNFGLAGVSNRFNKDTFCKLLRKFKNIESLAFFGVILTASIARETLQQLYDLNPNLKTLHIAGGIDRVAHDLIQICGNNLQDLSFSYPPQNSFDFSNVNFNKLQQVMLTSPAIKTMNEILKSAQNIRTFTLYPNGFNKRSPTKEDLKTIIPSIFEHKSLEYFEIIVNNDNYLQIFDGIESGLYETKRFERNKMKIRVNGWNDIQINLQRIMLNIGRIVTWLEKSKIKHFMFICDMRNMSDKCKKELDVNYISNELNDISKNVKVSENGLWFVIMNADCNICGYQNPFGFNW